MLELSKVKKIHFVGIGGIGMSAASGIAKAKGFEVSGSDSSDIYEPSLQVLKNHNIPYSIGYDSQNLGAPDLVVATAAVDLKNPEIFEAQKRGIKIVSYPELLGALTFDKRRIVVVGTHGKGSTSGLLGFALSNLNDSSFFVGGVLRNFNSNFHFGSGEDFVLEGDEYKSSAFDLSPKLLHYNANVLLLNNIELDHPDLYPDLASFKNIFKEAIQKLPEEGFLVYNADDQNVCELVSNSNSKAKKFSFGFEDRQADFFAERQNSGDGNFTLKIRHQNTEYLVTSKFPGLPYASNNLAAFATLFACGYEPQDFTKLFFEYDGLKRRFEILFENPFVLIDDYAHHASAVKATLEAAREKYPGRKITCFFEPHTYSRTKETLPELANAFGSADSVYIAEIYPAREIQMPGSITGAQVVFEISKTHKNCHLVKDHKEAFAEISKNITRGEVVIAMTVGDQGTKLLENLKAVKIQNEISI